MSVNLNQTSVKKVLVYDNSMSKKDPVSNCSIVKDSVGVQSVSDMVAKLTAKREVFDVIVISGHGCTSCQGVGSGAQPGYTPSKDLKKGKLNDVSMEINALRNLMFQPKSASSKCPIIFLAGCNVGDVNPQSGEAELLKELSLKMRNVCVIASALEIAPYRVDDTVQFLCADNGGKLRGELQLIHCSNYLNGERLDDSEEVLAITGYEGNYDKLIQDLSYWK